MTQAPTATSSDTTRQVVVLLSTLVAIVGGVVGSGAFGGTPIAEAAGGALSADATPIAPAGPAFAIWSVIYVGLVAYTVWQLLPGQKASERQRRLGYLMAASLILNAAWILSVQAGLVALSVVVIVVLLVVLALAFRQCLASRPQNGVEAVVVDGVVGLYLGWVCVATAANIAAALADAGFTGWGIDADAWGALVVAVAGIVGVALAIGGRGRISPALSLCWGLCWVAVGRLAGEPYSMPTAVTAIIAVATVVVLTVVMRLRAERVTR
jgi:TspO/MBR family